MSDYHKKLIELVDKVCEDFSDETDSLKVYWPDRTIDSNYPWLYIRFGWDGTLDLQDLKKIEKRFQDFCTLEGGSFQSLRMFRRGVGFTVKIVYVESKKELPGTPSSS